MDTLHDELDEDKKCLDCGKQLEGRADQKYCSSYCKSNYHNQKNKDKKEASLYRIIDRQIKQNRLILKKYNLAGKSTLRKEKLLANGFNPHYFTHYWKTKEGKVYLFCYEFGFLAFNDLKGNAKYTLITWQDYMKH